MKKLRLLGALVAIASFTFMFSCSSDGDGGGTTGCELDVLFSVSSSAVTGETITPNNQTLNGFSYTWDFGDGSAPVNSSTLAAPAHFYTTTGTFTVTLTAYCEAGQTGESGTYTSTITVTQANPTAAVEPSVFTRTSDEAPVYPVAANMQLGNASSQANSFTVDWGDGNSDNYASIDENPTHAFDMEGTYTITMTAYELPDQQGSSDETTFDIIIQNYNRLRVTKFTLHPAINDSLGTRWDDGTNGDLDNDGSEADLLMLVYNFTDDSTNTDGLIPLFAQDALQNVGEITTPIDIDVAIPLTDGSTQDFINLFAPLEEWNQALHPVFFSNSLGAIGYGSAFPIVLLMEIDVNAQGGGTVFNIFDIDEAFLVGATGTSYTLTNDNGDPVFEIHFELELQDGQ